MTTPADATHLAAAVEESTEAVLAVDLQGCLRRWNPAAMRLLGAHVLVEDEDLVRAFADSHRVRELLVRAGAGEPVRHEPVRLAGARRVPVVLTVLPHEGGLTVVVRQVDDGTRDHAEERLTRVESLGRTGTFVIDGHDRSAQWSLGMYLVHGLTPGSVLPSLAAHVDLLDEADRPALVRMVSAALYGQTPPGLDHRRRHDDGSETWVHVAVEPLLGPDGHVMGVTGVCQDVTEWRQTETALEEALLLEREAGEQLRQADQVRREFLATVSHELRGPLTTIGGFVPFLRARAPEHAALIEPIERKVAQMTRLVETLLDDARLTAGQVDLAVARFPVAQAARELVHERVGGTEGEQWVLHADEDLMIDMDPEAFVLVLGNFVGNAVKYAGDALITVTAQPHEDGVMVAVSDLGPGIAPEHQERLFDAYYRVPGAQHVARGSGFGLSIARRYVELHGGSVACSSTLGAGTTFSFVVPVVPSAPTAATG